MQSTIGLLRSKYCKQDVVPENGLAIFCGMVLQSSRPSGASAPSKSNSSKLQAKNNLEEVDEETEEQEDEEEQEEVVEEETTSSTKSKKQPSQGKERLKKVIMDVIPLVPLKHSLYFCDNRFHVEQLLEGLQDCIINDDESSSIGVGKAKKLGFIIITGDGALFALLSGNSSPQVLHEMKVQLPKKHGRGGQSKLRFERIRLEARHNFLVKVAEKANQCFLSNFSSVIVDGIILAGYASLKDAFLKEELMDYRLRSKIAAVVDTQYGGLVGLREAIEKCGSGILQGIRYAEEKNLIESFMFHLIQNEHSVIFGIHLTMHALEMQTVKTLLICEDCPWQRCVLQNGRVVFSKNTIPCLESMSVVEYCISKHKEWGVEKLHLLGMKNNETVQFQNGFDGIAGFLHYNIDFALENEFRDNQSEDFVEEEVNEEEEEDLDGFL